MRLTKEFIVGDLIKYLTTNDNDLLDGLKNGEMYAVIDLLMIGNKCNEEEALNIFNEAIKEMNYEQIVKQLVQELFVSEATNDNEKASSENKKLVDILFGYLNELQTIDENITISDFLSMNMETLYKYSEGIKNRYLVKENGKLRDSYTAYSIFMSMFTGKLKECPQLNEDGTLKQKSVKDKLLALKKNGGA